MTIPHHYSMHPLLSSVIHLPFKTAIKRLGCSQWSPNKFNEALTEHLATLPDSVSWDNILDDKLWNAMMNGEVLAAEHVDNEGFLFLVQGKIQRNEWMNMRFYYYKDCWSIQAITSIHQRPFRWSYWRSVSEIAVGVVAVAIIVGLWSHDNANYSKQTVEAWAQNHGYQMISAMSSENGTRLASSTPSNHTIANTKSNEITGNSATKAIKAAVTANSKAITHAQPHTYSITFQSGMTVHDISVFLQDHHLISNAYDFDNVLQNDGVATSVWPGTYVFKSNMNQNQLIAVLKSTPSH